MKRPGERRTHIVIALTAAVMGVEVVSRVAFGSRALLADGLHMASDACALTISALAYLHTRRHARNMEISFGAGRMNALGGFTGAVLLAAFAVVMCWESVAQILSPVGIAFNQANAFAVVGLAVNGACVVILGRQHEDHEHSHDHHHKHDHNLRSAYLHVLADALTSVLAIFALLASSTLSSQAVRCSGPD